jgi:hypothetical protein
VKGLVVAGLLLAILSGAANDPMSDATARLRRPHLWVQVRQSGAPGSDARVPDPLSEDVRAALDGVLEPSERVDQVAAAVGSTLVMTDRRVFVIRDGARYRPRSGVRWWPLQRDLTLRLARVRHDTSRLVIALEGRSASVFLNGTQLGDVQALVAAVRHRAYADS